MNGARIFGRRISQAKQNGVKGITTKDKPDPQWLIDYKAKVLKMDFSKVKTTDSADDPRMGST